MWPSVSRSDRARSRAAGVALLLTLSGSGAVPAGAAESIDAALARIFPAPGSVTKDTLFLTVAQAQAVEREAGTALPSRIVTRYVARDGAEAGAIVGFAYLETHLVRTVPETLLMVVDPDGRVTRVEVLDFREPPEYRPSRRWYEQFEGRPLDDDLRLKRGIRTLSGATLSSAAATDAVRRALAIHGVAGKETSPR